MNRKPKILLSTILAAILLLGNTVPVNMVGNWYQQFMPSLNGRQINDIIFTDSLNGYAITSKLSVTDSSLILKTTNGGDNWTFNHSDSGVSYLRIQFINQNTGFVGGYIYAGSSFHFVKTTNAGLSWFYINAPFDKIANDMFVLNEDTIWIADGDNAFGGVFRTTNGGVNWVRTDLFSLGGNPDKIYMYNRSFGFASSLGTVLYRTTNGGENWSRITGPIGFYDIKFTDSLTGWKCSNINGTPHFDKTTNGGINWFSQVIPYGGMIISPQVSSISLINADTLFAVGAYIQYPNLQSRGIIYRTTNGGLTWHFQVPDTTIHLGGYVHVQFLNKKIGWAYCISVGGIHTTTGGDTGWITGVKQISSEVPKQFRLYQNYPNPFNPNTNIKYQIIKNKYVLLTVYDITGKHIIDLVNQKQTAGTYQVDFSATGGGNAYSSGIYLYTLIVDGNIIDTKKMILIK